MNWPLDKWREKNQPFNFFGGNFGARKPLTKAEYDAIMAKRWRNPWYAYDKDTTTEQTTVPYADPSLAYGSPGSPENPTTRDVTSDVTSYSQQRDTGFAGAMAKTIASGLAKAAKPKKMSGGRVSVGGRQRTFTPDSYNMASWAAPAAPSNYQETLADPTIETYLRPWRLKHGYT